MAKHAYFMCTLAAIIVGIIRTINVNTWYFVVGIDYYENSASIQQTVCT